MSEMRNLRFRRGMTLDDLYLAVDRRIEPGTLSRIERGVLQPSAEKKDLIARALGVSVEEAFPPNGAVLTIHQEKELFKRLSNVMTLEDRIDLIHGQGNYQAKLLQLAGKYHVAL